MKQITLLLYGSLTLGLAVTLFGSFEPSFLSLDDVKDIGIENANRLCSYYPARCIHVVEIGTDKGIWLIVKNYYDEYELNNEATE